jgi:DNA-binding MarR family transcriptional regulator
MVRVEADVRAGQAQSAFAAIVRSLGLLRPDTTPCGQPVSVTQAHAISELGRRGALSQRSLGASLRLEKSTISRLVDQMVELGLVVRRANPTDRRSVLVELTATGRRRAERLRVAQQSLFEGLLDQVPPGDRDSVVHGLQRLEEAARALEQ